MKSISVLHILQTPLDYVGGPATYVKEISRHLSMKGVRVGIIAPAQPKYSHEVTILRDKYEVALHFVKTSFLNHLIRTPLIYSLKAHRTIGHVLRYYDVINVHVEATLLQSFTSLFDNKKLLLTVHGMYPFEDIETLRYYPLNLHRLIHLMTVSPQHMLSLKKLSPRSKHIMPVSKFLANLLIKHYRIPEEKIVVIPNSVDINAFKPQPFDKSLEVMKRLLVLKNCARLIENEKVILFLGRLEPRKGLHILVKALCKLNDKSWLLIIVGSGNSRYVKMCLDLANKYDLSDRICFIGKMPRSFLKYLYSSAYVYVLPSMFEGLPGSVLEAMACGSPVIATKVGGLPEVIKQNVTGLLINKPDPAELAETLELILTNENLRRKLSNNGLNFIKRYFSWQANTEKYIKACIR